MPGWGPGFRRRVSRVSVRRVPGLGFTLGWRMFPSVSGLGFGLGVFGAGAPSKFVTSAVPQDRQFHSEQACISNTDFDFHKPRGD